MKNNDVSKCFFLQYINFYTQSSLKTTKIIESFKTKAKDNFQIRINKSLYSIDPEILYEGLRKQIKSPSEELEESSLSFIEFYFCQKKLKF